MGFEVYALVILSSLALLVVAVDPENDFGEETSGPKADKIALVYLRNKQVSKNVLIETLFKPVSSFFFFIELFFFFLFLSAISSYIPCRRGLLRNRTTKVIL